jgi:hypothetical protein
MSLSQFYTHTHTHTHTHTCIDTHTGIHLGNLPPKSYRPVDMILSEK